MPLFLAFFTQNHSKWWLFLSLYVWIHPKANSKLNWWSGNNEKSSIYRGTFASLLKFLRQTSDTFNHMNGSLLCWSNLQKKTANGLEGWTFWRYSGGAGNTSFEQRYSEYNGQECGQKSIILALKVSKKGGKNERSFSVIKIRLTNCNYRKLYLFFFFFSFSLFLYL